MPTFLSDPTNGFYIIALIIALVGIGLWYRSRDKGSVVRAAILVGALVLVFAIDKLVESPREESVRKVNEITAAINEKNQEKFLANISDDFEYKGIKKDKLKDGQVWKLVEQHSPKVSSKTDREDVQYPSKTNPNIVIGFTSRIESAGMDIPVYFRATFGKDSDGQWRLKTFTAYDDPIKKGNGSEMNLPGLP